MQHKGKIAIWPRGRIAVNVVEVKVDTDCMSCPERVLGKYNRQGDGQECWNDLATEIRALSATRIQAQPVEQILGKEEQGDLRN